MSITIFLGKRKFASHINGKIKISNLSEEVEEQFFKLYHSGEFITRKCGTVFSIAYYE